MKVDEWGQPLIPEYTWNNFNNVGFIMSEFTEEELKPVRDEVAELHSNLIEGKKANDKLAGHLANEYYLTKSKPTLERLLTPLFQEYDHRFNYLISVDLMTSPAPFVLDDVWVNFQRKHEFNPVHNHSGIFSFALWLAVPYKIEEELALFPNIRQNNNQTGCFVFHYTNSLGDISHHTLQVDKTYENKVVVFPSRMQHSVNPFYTSDEFRISVSGNVKFKV